MVVLCHSMKLKEISTQMEDQRAVAATHTAQLNEIGAQLKSLAAEINQSNHIEMEASRDKLPIHFGQLPPDKAPILTSPARPSRELNLEINNPKPKYGQTSNL
ncbi:OLC1v1012267C1 [Oldenlandia corymbosa var. corymbosa]|uniref:OLC1v1012267C1 n=1 Tax=Oldenlandia corymbosa var. corymbosa TaxID=529605 RepID=A0AAV1DVI9_OLDCO|nr:OLC1v1012267C1 [Oldenlandia corymbosa var. corymbosa]